MEALRYYNMCVSVSPGNVVGYTNRALCHLKLNSVSVVCVCVCVCVCDPVPMLTASQC